VSTILSPLRRRPSIAVSDADALAPAARRTRFVRLGLAAAALVLLGGALLLARGLTVRPNSYFAAGGSGIVVVDLSTSVDPARYRRLSRVLRTIVETNQPVGLVVYSDAAYEMLPPGTRGAELRPLLRFFEPPQAGRAGERRTRGFGFPESPWAGTFRGGTRISTGLGLAREVIDRDGIVPGSVLLVSDLDDSVFDLPALTQEVIRYQRDGLRLRLVPLFPAPDDRELFGRLAGQDAFVTNDELLENTALEERRTVVGEFPLALVLAGGLLLLVVAANERLCGRLAWRGGQL
jgi:hypothetical protein